jgi:hypothetical protein
MGLRHRGYPYSPSNRVPLPVLPSPKRETWQTALIKAPTAAKNLNGVVTLHYTI